MMQKQPQIAGLKPKSETKRRWLILQFGLLVALGPLVSDMYLPALPAIAKHLQTIASMTQLCLTAGLLGLSIGQLIFGAISDVHGRRLPLLSNGAASEPKRNAITPIKAAALPALLA